MQRCDYDSQVEKWVRTSPKSFSDFVSRPLLIQEVIMACGEDKEAVVVDAGCGEGYVARQIAPYARKILGFDASAGMVEAANKTKNGPLALTQSNTYFFVHDLNDPLRLQSSSVDVY